MERATRKFRVITSKNNSGDLDGKFEDGTLEVMIMCVYCGEYTAIPVKLKDYKEFRSPNRRYVQDIFPYLDAGQREMLISNTCPKCWDDLYGQFE
jgi:hypothetical protein